MSQKEVWNLIAKQWKTFRKKTLDEVKEFFRGKDGKVLDLGCGSGRNFVKFKGTIYGVDFSEKMLRYARKRAKEDNINVKLFNSDLINLPFKDSFFDSAIFIASLHCVETPKKRKKALEELLRVLKPNSEALVAVWDKNQPKFKEHKKEHLVLWKHKGVEFRRYYYLYEKKEITRLLKEVGFKILRVNNSENPNGLYSKKNIILLARKP